MTLARMAAEAALAAGRSLHRVGIPGFRTCQRRFVCMGPFRGKPRACRSGESSAGWPAPGSAAPRVPPGTRRRDPQDLTGSASGDRAGSTGCTCSWAYWPGRGWLPVSLRALGRAALAVQVRYPSAALWRSSGPDDSVRLSAVDL